MACSAPLRGEDVATTGRRSDGARIGYSPPMRFYQRSLAPRAKRHVSAPGSRIGWRALRIALIAAAVFVGLPYLLTPLYAVVDPPSTLMLWRWLTGARVVRQVVPLEQMGPYLPVAVMVAEDARFCTHHGVDFRELRDVIDNADDPSEMRGVSTIPQQTVKNLFLWPGRSYVRKALEMPLALWFDLVLSKRRILEIYLNIAEWGAGRSIRRRGRGAPRFRPAGRDADAAASGIARGLAAKPGHAQSAPSRSRPVPARRALPVARRPLPGRRMYRPGAVSRSLRIALRPDTSTGQNGDVPL